MIPVALSIAGSDPSGGAGIQADLKTFLDLGVYGMAVPTALTVQDTRGVRGVHPVPPDVVAAQVRAVVEDIPPGAVKIGMLHDAGVARAVAGALAGLPAASPVVLDPVIRSSSGRELLDEAGRAVILDSLLPRCALLTPNIPELRLLFGTADGAEAAGRFGVPVLLTGGHAEGAVVEDRLFLPGEAPRVFRHPRLRSRNTHGTGCTLSSAVAARLARGDALPAAVEAAVAYVHALLARSAGHRLGGGVGPMLHGPVGAADPPDLSPRGRSR